MAFTQQRPTAFGQLTGGGGTARPASGHRRRFLASAVFGVYTVTFVAWVAWGGGSVRSRTVISDLAFLPAGPAAAYFAWRAASHPVLEAAARRGWRLIALALVSWSVGDALWCFFEVVLDQEPFPSAADVFYLGFYFLLLAGLVVVGRQELGSRAGWRLTLDALTVTAVGALVVWLVAIEPTVMDGGPGWLGHLLDIVYPVGDVLVLFGLAVILLRRPPPSTAAALRVLMAGALAFVAADLAYTRLSLSDSYDGIGLPDVLWMTALALFLLAGQVQHVMATTVNPVIRDQSPAKVSAVPYAAVATGFGILLFSARHEGAEFVVLLTTAVVIAALVAARQVVALRDIARLTDELEAALTRSEVALATAHEEEERSRRFLADVAHHLRTPIAGLQACADTLLRGGAGEQQEALLRSVGEEAARAGRLVGDLLAMARLDSGAMLLAEPTSLITVCEQEAEKAQARSFGTPVHVVRGDTVPDLMAVDPEALHAAVGSLLENAVRHAQERVEVWVGTAGPAVEVRVSDDGPGIDPEAVPRMFDRFVALDGKGGSGLGLAISRGYARAHNGDLTYEDGAFVLRLPMPTSV